MEEFPDYGTYIEDALVDKAKVYGILSMISDQNPLRGMPMELSRSREFINLMYHFPGMIFFALDNMDALDRTTNSPNNSYWIYRMLLS